MILTVCMSPCIDVYIELDALNVGQLNHVKSKSLSFTGKSINVAIGVKRLGADAFSTGFMYEENSGLFENALRQEGIPFSFVCNSGRVRENYKLIDKKSMLTEINDVGGQVGEGKLKELTQKLSFLSENANVTVISGGLPRGVEPSYYGDLVRAVSPRSLKIVDSEGGRLFSALNAGVDLVKPNREELEQSLGRKLENKEDMLFGCRELLERGAKIVLLSLGREGAVITDGRKNFYCRSINVAVNSTVGAGDGMVAAAAVSLEKGAGLDEILRAGVAAGTATVTNFGTVSFTKAKYDEIYQNLVITEF